MAVVTDSDAGAVVRAFVEDVWNGADPAAIDALTTDDFVLHQLVAGEDHDRDGFAAFHAEMLDAMPDLSVDVEDLLVDGDDAVALVRMRGTPEKPMQALRPTGRSFDVNAFQKYRLEGGRVAEVWVMVDAIGTLSQLGVFPPSPRLMARIALGKLRARLPGR